MRFFSCLKNLSKCKQKKKLSPKNISECKLRILRCSTNCENRIGNQFENAVIFRTKKKRQKMIQDTKNQYNWEITGSRLSSGLRLSGYDRGRREWVSSISLTCNPCYRGYQNEVRHTTLFIPNQMRDHVLNFWGFFPSCILFEGEVVLCFNIRKSMNEHAVASISSFVYIKMN